MSDRNPLLLFMLAVTVPLSGLALAVAVPRLSASDDGRIWLLAFIALLCFVGGIGALKTLAMPIFRFIRASWLRRHQSEAEYGVTPPCCKGCGYDLRASPDVCPECGTRVDRMDGTIIRYLMTLRRRDELDHTPHK